MGCLRLLGLTASLWLAPFLTAGATEPPALFPNTDNLARVIMGENGRQLNVAGDRIFAEGLAGRTAAAYFVLRPGPPLAHQTSGRRLGRSNIHLGRARVERRGNPTVLRIEQARREIRPGDYLWPIASRKPTE